jgi:predicted transcriptional regulator
MEEEKAALLKKEMECLEFHKQHTYYQSPPEPKEEKDMK